MLDDAPTALLDCVLGLLLLSLGVSAPLLTGWVIWNRRKVFSNSRYFVRLGVFVGGLLAFCLLVHYDPGHIWNWFFD